MGANSAENARGSLLSRAAHVLHAFSPEDGSIPLAELVRRTGLPKTTVHRITSELSDLGLLGRDKNGAFHLGRNLFELGMRASVERQLIEIAMPFMQDLFARTRVTVHLGVLEGDEVVYVSKMGGHRQDRVPSRLGGRMPLHCTAIGKALLAYSNTDLVRAVLAGSLERRTPNTITAPGILHQQLSRILSNGVAYEHEESRTGIVCVAAPVLDSTDHPVAAISLAGNAPEFKPEQHQTVVGAAAGGIGSTLARREQLQTREF